MKKLDLFLLKSFLGPFIMVFFIVVFILVMQFLWLYIDDLVGKGLRFLVILEFLWWGSCTILPLAMPLATLLASLMTLGNLGESNELLAMKAAGVSLPRILTPLIIVAVTISIGAFFVSNNLVPVSYNKIYTLRYDIGRTKNQIKIPTGAFYNGIEGYSLRIDSRNEKTDMMYDVIIYDHSSNEGNIAVAVSDSGTIMMTNDHKSLILNLYNGISYKEDNKIEPRDTSLGLQKVAFRMQEVVIPLENYTFEKSDDDRYGSEIMARRLSQLMEDRDSIGKLHENVLDSHQKLLNSALNLTFASQLDTAKRVDSLPVLNLAAIPAWENDEQELKALENAIRNVKSTVTTMEDYDRDVQRNAFFLRRIDLESYRKFTLSFACLIFFFIGAPLGAIIRKGGLGTPVIISALFFVLYWVVDISGKKLARDGATSPMMGAFISTLVLFPIGVFLSWASTKDASFDLKTIGTFFKNIPSFLKWFYQFLKSTLTSKRKVTV